MFMELWTKPKFSTCNCNTYPIKSRSLKIKVLEGSKPTAMMSFALLNAICLAASILMSFHMAFSSSVSWMINGTSNTSCNHLKMQDTFLFYFKFNFWFHASADPMLWPLWARPQP